MTDKLLRTFISVTVPKEVVMVQDMLKTTIQLQKGNVRWVTRGQIHLTLKFLGHTPPEDVHKIDSIIEQIMTHHGPIDLVVKGTGNFPDPRRPRTLWLGLDGNIEALTALTQEINNELEPLGYPIEDSTFVPHITIARIKYPPHWTPDITSFLNTSYEPIPMIVNRIRFMASELLPNGPIHSILGTHFSKSTDIEKGT